MTDEATPSTVGQRIAQLLEHPTSDQKAADIRALLSLSPGVSPQDVIGGDYPLTPSDLVTLADWLDVPATVLSGQTPMSHSLGVSLRLGSLSVSGAPTDALLYAEKVLGHQRLLDSWLGVVSKPLQSVSPSQNRYFLRAGEVTAARVRDALNLGDEPIGDLVALVESLGFPVVFRSLPAGVQGLNVKDERDGVTYRLIVVSTEGPWTQQRFTLAHELCHGLYDDDDQVIVDRLEVPDVLPELRAESFARHFLMPKAALKRQVDDARADGRDWSSTVAEFMLKWGVSKRAAIRALVADELVGVEELAEVESASVASLMNRLDLAADWVELSSQETVEAGSPWLIARAIEAFGSGYVGVRVVADLLGRNETETAAELAAQGW